MFRAMAFRLAVSRRSTALAAPLRSGLKQESRRLDLRAGRAADGERRGGRERVGGRPVKFRQRCTKRSAEGARARRSARRDVVGMIGVARIGPGACAVDLNRRGKGLRRCRMAEIQDRAECKQQAQDRPRPALSRRAFRGPSHAITVTHQRLDTFGIGQPTPRSTLSATPSHALIQIKTRAGPGSSGSPARASLGRY